MLGTEALWRGRIQTQTECQVMLKKYLKKSVFFLPNVGRDH